MGDGEMAYLPYTTPGHACGLGCFDAARPRIQCAKEKINSITNEKERIVGFPMKSCVQTSTRKVETFSSEPSLPF